MNIEVIYHLYDVRTEKNLSRKALAEISGVEEKIICDIEHDRHDPTVQTLCMLADALETSTEALYSYMIR